MKPCSNPLCTNQVDDGDRFCGMCGTYVGPDITQAGVQCVNCGRTLQQEQNFCPDCGSFTTFFKPQPTAAQSPNDGIDASATTIPGTIAKYVNRGNLLLRLSRYEDALRMFDEVLRVDTDNVEALHGKAHALYGLKKYDDVIQLCENMLLDNWDDADAHYWSGSGVFASERYYEALSAFDEALRLNPKDVSLHNYKGMALRRLGRKDAATEEFRQGVQYVPKSRNTAFGVNWIALCRSFVISARRKTSAHLYPKSLLQVDRALLLDTHLLN